MPRGALSKNFFGFPKGKITEATGLTYPEGSMIDGLNVDLNFDGSVRRRKGIDYETDYTQGTVSNLASLDMVQTWVWNNCDFNGGGDAIVIRTGLTVKGYSIIEDSIDMATPLFEFSLNPYIQTGTARREPISVTFAKGAMIFTGENLSPGYYNEASLNEYIVPYIRDLVGLEKTAALDNRPTTLSDNRKYNLINNGWPDQLIRYKDTGGATRNAYAWVGFQHWVGLYPALSDIYDGHGQEIYTPSIAKNSPATTGRAPLGKYILPLFEQDRAAVSGIPVVETVLETDKRPRAVTYFQGHLVFGGVDHTDYEEEIYFSQTLTDLSKAGLFYSVNDPTSDITNSPLATDGGIIRIEGMGKVTEIKPLQDSVFVFADNGVWSISNADESSFSINNAFVTKVTNAGCIAGESIVEFENNIVYWSKDGIYLITKPQGAFKYQAINLTETTIQSYYISISDTNKQYCKGLADPLTRKIYWLFNDFNEDDSGFNQNFNRVLIFDTRLQAFYDYEFSYENSSGPFVCSAFYNRNATVSEQQDQVIIGANNVQVSGDNVYIVQEVTSATDTLSRLRYLAFEKDDASSEYTLTWSRVKDSSFLDWYTRDATGIDYSSYVESGYDLASDPMREKQFEYIFTYFNRTETAFEDDGSGNIVFDAPSGCLMRTKWDWTTTSTANRWSEAQQVYRFKRNYIPSVGAFDYSYDVIETKNRVRGKGKSILMRFESETGKDFQLLGWAVFMTAGADV